MNFSSSPQELRRLNPELALSLETAYLLLELESTRGIEWFYTGTDLSPFISVKLSHSRTLLLAPHRRLGETVPTWGEFKANSDDGRLLQHLRVHASIQEETHISMMFSVEAFSIEAVIEKVRLVLELG